MDITFTGRATLWLECPFNSIQFLSWAGGGGLKQQIICVKLNIELFQVAQLISSDTITVPNEEKVFESVISWIQFEPDSRYCL